MKPGPVLHLARVFLRIFLRDRQSIFIGLFFPIVFLSVVGFLRDRPADPVAIGIASHAPGPATAELQRILETNPLFTVTTGSEDVLRDRVRTGDATLVLVIPPDFDDAAGSTELAVVVDAAQVRLLGLILPALEKALLDVERQVRHTQPMFSLRVEDVQARSQHYIDFLLPGIIAFTLMQISVAGSGFNIVEYRRKGILKRLFVTPIRPAEFIAALCLARLAWCLLQVSGLLLFATWVLDAQILGNYGALYVIIVLGSIIFLCLGFCVGSVAKTQQAVAAVGNLVIFPQLFLSGVFFPLESMPDVVQPLARLLPLSFVVTCLRDIASNGLGLVGILPTLLGVAVWIALSFVLATRLFVWKEVVNA